MPRYRLKPGFTHFEGPIALPHGSIISMTEERFENLKDRFEYVGPDKPGAAAAPAPVAAAPVPPATSPDDTGDAAAATKLPPPPSADSEGSEEDSDSAGAIVPRNWNQIAQGTVESVVGLANELTSLADLDQLLRAEKRHRSRKTVLKAIEDRIEALSD